PQPLFHKNIDLLRKTVRDYHLQSYRLCIMADSKKQIERVSELIRGEEDGARLDISIESTPFTIHEGFTDNDLHVCFFTDHQVFDRFHKFNLQSEKARNGKIALTMKELQELEPGDFLVHVDFGIGKFGGLVRVPLPQHNGAKQANDDSSQQAYQEMIRIIYQRGDIVDVSIHSLYKISKYRSAGDGQTPRLSTLGTGAWERMKERTKKRIKDIARDLIRLYASRQQATGFAFSPDSFLQHELEAGFLYEDTPDQLRATNEVKADMESKSPMDRLVCGDVGFGKTEVAVRAAFKAACDSKQVAVLVPTTVLAFQHYQTFRDRLKNMPVRVDYLSRARTAKQTRQILADLKEGKIDILIGTHKLIGKQVEWKDLGLLIIDEEQKFGVAVKEKLRTLKNNIDTLTMSATPIPRTLQFSLMGARDMSIIRTPPPNRYPIQTEISTYNSETIADAINFEMSRNGQVFFVNDRISNLEEIKLLIIKHVPDCRVAIGHGQMKPDELEKIVMGFINYDYDVLLSTTIVENGIDISNANTIIINDAHRFGLSDLHQMRGRVGRSNRKAFCYLLAPPKSLLPADARRRLEALETFSELGSGFNLAMQDLDIRGAGNLLGAEQSGFMEDLGYETYLKIIRQAMVELRNEKKDDVREVEVERTKNNGAARESEADDNMMMTVMGESVMFVDDCALESDLEMYFPDTYVPTSSERMLLYRELDNVETDEQLEAYRSRLEDRFGPVPKQGEELMHVVALRRIGKRLGCEKIILRQGRMQMQFVSNADSPYYQSSAFDKVLNFVAMNARRCNLKEVNSRRLMVVSNVLTVEDAVAALRAIDS
ncbi:MAG: DEAD/DEAH box helicase, partial [Prevotella sp.]|nr:DEAD/DEAH box helicase [Prevotella sp.]